MKSESGMIIIKMMNRLINSLKHIIGFGTTKIVVKFFFNPTIDHYNNWISVVAITCDAVDIAEFKHAIATAPGV